MSGPSPAIVVLLFLAVALSRAERDLGSIEFTAENCASYGSDGANFDVCGTVEFCEPDVEEDGRARRLARHGKHNQQHHHHQHGSSHNGKTTSTKSVEAEEGSGEEETAEEDEATTAQVEGPGESEEGPEDPDQEAMESFEMEDSKDLDDMGEMDYMADMGEMEDMSDLYGSGAKGNTPAENEDYSDTADQSEGGDGDNGIEIPTATFGYRIPGTKHCTYPGPVMRLQRGKKHGLFVVNKSTRSTNVHLHGLHINGDASGDSILRVIPFGATGIYTIDLPADKHLGGTHWYHPHLHGEAWEQTRGGAFGMIVISDEGHDVGTDDSQVLEFLEDERLLVVDYGIHERKAFSANGLGKDEFKLNRNEWYRFRMLMVDTDSYSDGADVYIGDECEVRPLAHDGIWRFKVPGMEEHSYFLTSASRLDIAIKCDSSSVITVREEKKAILTVEDGGTSDKTPFEHGEGMWMSTRPAYVEDLREAAVAESDKIEMQIGETNINGKQLLAREPICNDDGEDFTYDTVVEWTVVGANTHPFHSHGYPMQVITSGCGSAHEIGEFYDTIVKIDADFFNPCVVRVKLVDVSGPVAVHCHIFQHAEQGAQGFFQVKGGPETDLSTLAPQCVSNGCEEVELLPSCSSD